MSDLSCDLMARVSGSEDVLIVFPVVESPLTGFLESDEVTQEGSVLAEFLFGVAERVFL